VGPRAGLDRCGKSRPHRYSISGPSSPWPVVISTELPGPLLFCSFSKFLTKHRFSRKALLRSKVRRWTRSEKKITSVKHQDSFSSELCCSGVIPTPDPYSGDTGYFSWPCHLLPSLFYSLSLENRRKDMLNVDCVDTNDGRYR
jgi:hypothetical protein